MKLKLVITVLFIAQAIGENDDLKGVGEVEVKSAKTEDDAKPVSELNREAESYTVPVEVVKDAVTESELVRNADADDRKEDSRVERSTPTSDVEDLSGLKLDESDTLFSESEHINNRRSNDETKSVDDSETLVKSGDSEDTKERQAKPEAEEEKDDLSKKGEEAKEEDDVQVKSANDADVEQKSAVEVTSTLDEAVDGLAKVAEVNVEEIKSLLNEGVEELHTNLNTRRMLNPIGPFLDNKARGGDKIGINDEGLKSVDNLGSLDSPRLHSSQTILPPLMPMPNKENFFLTPALPQLPTFYHSTQTPLFRMQNMVHNKAPLKINFFRSTEEKPINALHSQPMENPRTFLQFPLTTLRPLVPHLPLANLPSFEHLFRKPAEDFNTQGIYHQYSNQGYNKRLQVPYSVPSYLQYRP